MQALVMHEEVADIRPVFTAERAVKFWLSIVRRGDLRGNVFLEALVARGCSAALCQHGHLQKVELLRQTSAFGLL